MRTILGPYGKIGEFFWDPNDALEHLLAGDLFRGKKYVPLHDARYATRKRHTHPSSPLLTLPNEILSIIVLDIEMDVDRYCFGLCCLRLFALIEEQWLTHITDTQKRTRVLVIGDASSWDDFPPDSDNFKRLRKYQLSQKLEFVSQEALDEERPFEVLKQVSSHPETFESLTEPLENEVWHRLLLQTPEEVRKVYQWHIRNNIHMFYLKQQTDRRELDLPAFKKRWGDNDEKEVPFPFIPELETWYYSLQGARLRLDYYYSDLQRTASYVLRNHTKKVFVLENPFCTSFTENLRKMSNKRWPYRMTMTQVILSQCCLSSEGSDSMDGGRSDEIVRGPWAGDELDLVTETDLQMSFRRGEEDPKQWRNDGERVFEQMWRIVEVGDYRDPNTEPTAREDLVSLNHPGKTVQDLLEEFELEDKEMEDNMANAERSGQARG